MNETKYRKWLNSLIIGLEMYENSRVLDEEEYIEAFSLFNEKKGKIHITDGLLKIAETLDLQVGKENFNDKWDEISFIFKDYKFFQLIPRRENENVY